MHKNTQNSALVKFSLSFDSPFSAMMRSMLAVGDGTLTGFVRTKVRAEAAAIRRRALELGILTVEQERVFWPQGRPDVTADTICDSYTKFFNWLGANHPDFMSRVVQAELSPKTKRGA